MVFGWPKYLMGKSIPLSITNNRKTYYNKKKTLKSLKFLLLSKHIKIMILHSLSAVLKWKVI